MFLSLFIISAVASATLAFVYNATKEKIEIQKTAKKNAAIKNVLPAYANSPVNEMYMLPTEDGDSLKCYPGKDENGNMIGTAIETYDDGGFSERIYIMVGILPDGSVYNTAVLSHKETPGLGDKMDKKKSEWSNQFNGKNLNTFVLKVKKDGGEVDAITAATITSRAFTNSIARAWAAMQKGDKHE